MSWHNDFECYCPDEYEIDEYIAEMQLYHDIEVQAKNKIWTTKDGTKIPVGKMTASHILNTINLIKRKDRHDYYLPWIKVFEEEMRRRSNKHELS